MGYLEHHCSHCGAEYNESTEYCAVCEAYTRCSGCGRCSYCET